MLSYSQLSKERRLLYLLNEKLVSVNLGLYFIQIYPHVTQFVQNLV